MIVSEGLSAETAFPRGGRVRKSKDEKKSPDRNVLKEKDLFSSSNSSNNDPHAQKKRRKKQLEKQKARKQKETAKSVEVVDTLSYGQLVEGMLLLGRISSIRELDLRISLPGRLMASCPITNISSIYTNALKDVTQGKNMEVESDEYPRPLSSMFKLGQVIVCCVTDINKVDDSYYQITVSLDPSLTQGSILTKKILVDWGKNGHMPILMAAVKSIEDHGYVMDIGIQGARAFLPQKKFSKFAEEFLHDSKVSIGQLISCRVAEVSEEGLDIRLSCEPSKLSKQVLKINATSNISIHTLLPGTTIDCVASPISCKGGIKVDLGNELCGYIHRDHLDRNEENVPEEGSNVKARVIYVLPTLNTIHLTSKHNFALGQKPFDPFVDYKIGDIVKDAEVVETTRRGLILKFPKNSEKAEGLFHFGFVPVRHLTGAKEGEKNIHLKFAVGSLKACRIYQYDYSDAIFLCSLQKSVIEQSVLKVDNLVPGDIITGRVKRLERRGIFLDIGRELSDAFIPALHMSDVPLKHPEKKFAIGDKLKCRVLRVEPEKKKLFLTAKNILVNEEYPIIHQYDVQNIGKITEGVVVSVSTEGLLLQLFGETKGWVPKKLISSEGPIEYPEKLFFIGQALKCQVVDVDVERRRMTLSLIIGGTSKPLGHKEKLQGKKLKLCTFYQCKVADIAPGGLAVEIETKVDENNTEIVKAFVPKEHLTDHPSMADLLLRSYNIGEIIDRAVCFERDVMPIMTLKPIILEDVAENENRYENGRSFEELNDGLVIPGVVCLVKEYGVFLRLPTNRFRKSALIPTRYLSDVFVENPQDFVKIKQTLFGKIVEREENQQKITMSAKLGDVFLNVHTENGVTLIESLFRDIQRIQNYSPIPCTVGTVITCSVVSISEFGIETEVKSESADNGSLRGLIPKSNCIGLKEPKIGDVMCAVVVFVEHQFRCVELSPQPDLIQKVTLRKDQGHAIKEGQVVKASVILRRSELGFVLLCIKTPNYLSGHLVYVPTRDHINDMVGFADLYTIGETYSVVIKKKLLNGNESVVLIGMLEKHLKKSAGNSDKEISRKRQRLDSLSSQVSETSEFEIENKTHDKMVTKKLKNPAVKKQKLSKDIDFSVLKELSIKVLSETKQETEIKDETINLDEVEMRITTSVKTGKTHPKPGLVLPPGWDDNYNPWAGITDIKEEIESDDQEQKSDKEEKVDSSKCKKHLSKKEKKELDRLEAEEISRVEKQVLDGEKPEPLTTAEFDRLVLTSPDSSLCWIKYMAFYISKEDYAGARTIAKRALEKINFREEGEKLNVYMAWFNLENSFGSQEDADNCFKEALKCNDEFKVYSQVANVYENMPDKIENAEKIYKTMARKFCKEPEAWLMLGKHYFARKDKNLKEARFTLQRALQNLEKKHHIALSAKFAQYEFQFGESERGKQIFENIISNFPKRTDQWNVYIDLVIKNKEIDFARELFERMIGLNLKPIKTKFMFKKYMEFEQGQNGDDKQMRINNVRKKASEYLETLGIKLENEDDEVMDRMDNGIVE